MGNRSIHHRRAKADGLVARPRLRARPLNAPRLHNGRRRHANAKLALPEAMNTPSPTALAPSAEHAQCADLCLVCYRLCLGTFSRHGLHHAGAHLPPGQLMALLDCAEACRTAADFLLRGSPALPATCRTCAEICALCAESCRALEDPALQACADLCARCSESCRRMSGSDTAVIDSEAELIDDENGTPLL